MMRKLAGTPFQWVLTASVLLAVAASLYLYLDYRASVEGHKHVLVERGEALLDSLGAGMRAQGRMARIRGDRLPILFEETARIDGVTGVRLSTLDGAEVVAFGNVEGLDKVRPDATVWRETELIQTATLELPNDFHSGDPLVHRGWGGNTSAAVQAAPEGPYIVALALDARPTRADLWHETLRFGVSMAVALGAILLAAGLILLELRRMALVGDLKLAQEAAAELQRLAQLGAGLAHETKNPLNLVRGLAQDIVTSASLPSSTADKASMIVDEVDRTVGQINSFLEISRPKEAKSEPVRLDQLCAQVVMLLEPEAKSKDVKLESTVGELTVLGDWELLRRAILNLLLNAIRACAAGGHVRIEAEEAAGVAALSVIDDGCGIAPEDLPHIAEPYFTRLEGGTGLGLVIVQQVARLHGAAFEAASRPGEGARMSLTGLRAVH